MPDRRDYLRGDDEDPVAKRPRLDPLYDIMVLESDLFDLGPDGLVCGHNGVEKDGVDLGKAMVGEAIVGHEQIVLDANGPGALDPIPLASPNPMTPAELARHNLTHLP